MTTVPAILRPFGIDLFCLGKKFLVFNLVGRNLKIKYRRSVLGILWTLLAPLAMGAVYYGVFSLILKVQIPNYVVLVLSGILPWNFFAQSFMEGLESIVGHYKLISKIPLPLQVFPYVCVLTNLVTLLLAFPIIVAIALATGTPIGPSILMYFFYAGTLFILTYGMAHLAALLFVYFRDLRHLGGILLQIWFYSTPVLYHEDMIPESLQWALYANPLGMVFVGLHESIVYGRWPSLASVGVVLLWAAAILGAAALLHRTVAKTVAERI